MRSFQWWWDASKSCKMSTTSRSAHVRPLLFLSMSGGRSLSELSRSHARHSKDFDVLQKAHFPERVRPTDRKWKSLTKGGKSAGRSKYRRPVFSSSLNQFVQDFPLRAQYVVTRSFVSQLFKLRWREFRNAVYLQEIIDEWTPDRLWMTKTYFSTTM